MTRKHKYRSGVIAIISMFAAVMLLSACGSVARPSGESSEVGKSVEPPTASSKASKDEATPFSSAADNTNAANIYYTKAVVTQGGYPTQYDYVVVSNNGGQVVIPDNYQVIGPCSEELFMVRWLDSSDDSWGVGTDGVFHYGFMNVKGELVISLDDIATSIGLPLTNENDWALQCKHGAFFQEQHAVLTCCYGNPNNGNYRFKLVIDRQGIVKAWAGINSKSMDVPEASDMPYLSFYDAMGMENYPSYSVDDAYSDGLLRVSRGNSLVASCTILVDYDGNAYANFHSEPSTGIRSSDALNSQCAIVNGSYVYSYAPGNDAIHEELLLESDAFARAEDVDSAKFKGTVGDEYVIAVNTEKKTAKGNRTKAGLYDAQSGNWLTDSILGGSFDDIHDNVCEIKISGGYNDIFNDGAGLMAANGTWLFAPDRLIDGKAVSDFSHYVDNWWVAYLGPKGSSDARYLVDVDNPNSEPIRADGLVEKDSDGYIASYRDKELVDAVSG